MTSDLLYMTSHRQFMTCHPLNMRHDSHYIGNITPTMYVNINYIWHETQCVKTLQPLYMTSHSSCFCVITPTVSMIKHTLFMTSHLLYIWHHMHCIWHLTHDLWHHNTLLMTSNLLYLTSHRFYLRAHPLYLCHHTQIIDHTTPIVCMITQPQYVWHHINYICHHIHSLWYHTTLCLHSHCIHVITPRTPVIASTVAGPILIGYWLYHTYYICDMKPTTCMISQEFYMTSHSLFMT